MKKILLTIALIGILVAGVVGYLLYNKPHRDIGKASSDFVVDASTLFREFEEDEAAANTKYLDKVIKVRGNVKSAHTDAEGNMMLTLEAGDEMFGVTCTIPEKNLANAATIREGQHLTVKGVCTGKLMDVVLIRCVPED
ncbi:OB-fold protein [Botryobacter ruber]|uniref:OB-fold protein n=1 Tax=Botryobacter ruber TaxID=2171629 RepID=UPI000E0C36B5|nr:hypothetical protein [Botryobacter ruber]